ncbi:clathrin coat assembly protein AP180-like [Herpailurus yagouaroundi]|uniref:clathrin coat assembly protein AP180-like n=1 Tax=Herpailurus yagouaroundi TaxID=1608482 RepID=UPI001AD77601|nr:clathrin coat assembly protein AP180-like [Puma yagouaroundi]
MGSFASKAALGATTDEPTEPEPKHLADLIQYVNETNMSVKHLADVLSEKVRSSSWVVVFKALVTVHHLMVHGNEVSVLYIHSVGNHFLPVSSKDCQYPMAKYSWFVKACYLLLCNTGPPLPTYKHSLYFTELTLFFNVKLLTLL